MVGMHPERLSSLSSNKAYLLRSHLTLRMVKMQESLCLSWRNIFLRVVLEDQETLENYLDVENSVWPSLRLEKRYTNIYRGRVVFFSS